jgi:superfamily II DNA/RNA helicase
MQLPLKIQTAIANSGITELNDIQTNAFSTIQKQAEVLLLAPTGSGKTLAFLLPIFAQLTTNEKRVQCLILTPSRELAMQIEQVWKKMATGFKVNVCYGGHSMSVEKQNFKEPPTVLIGTPGRIADHLTRNTFDLSGIHTLVLDEFDKSLALGFHDQMSYITHNLKNLTKKILVSATSKIEIPTFTGIEQPWVLNFNKKKEKEEETPRLTVRTVYSEEKDKIECLFNLLCNLGAESTIIFCNHRDAAERTSKLLWEKGIENTFFHGGMEQLDREKTLLQFRNGTINFLVASDLAARGLDISAVKNIIHYHLPHKIEDYVHRNGRTARMHAEGDAYIIFYKDEPKPNYLPELPEEYVLQDEYTPPKRSLWTTLYINGGKKDKLSKGDIAGFLMKVGNLPKEEIGLIEIMDFMAFVAVKKSVVRTLLPIIQQAKLKGSKYKIEEAALKQ